MATLTGVQYSGIWNLSSQANAQGAGTWPQAFNSTGPLWGWGRNYYGELGLGTSGAYAGKSSPVQIGALSSWSTLSSGPTSVFGIYDNKLWSWGTNGYGQLGQGNTSSCSSPIQVGALTNWLAVAGGYNFGLAVKTDGTLWAWGKNNYGQLGLGNTTNYSSPKQVGALTNWLLVQSSLYGNYSMAIKTDGTLWAWGVNSNGQLGDGTTVYKSSPVQIGALTTWSKVTCCNETTGAIKTDGTLWTWGRGYAGALGNNGASNYVSSPTQVGALTNWAQIAGSYRTMVSIKTNGTAWSWGSNNYGQLGLGNTTNYSSPKQIGSDTNWLFVNRGGTSGDAFFHMTKTNRTLWGFGAGAQGQIGDNAKLDRSSPTQVSVSQAWIRPMGGGINNSFAITA
jgi:alpha-tubulin suppressor-like RCC1 family protein